MKFNAHFRSGKKQWESTRNFILKISTYHQIQAIILEYKYGIPKYKKLMIQLALKYGVESLVSV